MKRKPAQQIIIVIFGIFLNLIGKFLAAKLGLPLWLDVTGTCVAAYFAGPVGGIVAGIANNLIYGITTPSTSSLFYMFVSIVVGIIFAYCAKKRISGNHFYGYDFKLCNRCIFRCAFHPAQSYIQWW